MRRREFISLLGGAAVWPLAAKSQPSKPVVGFLHGATPDSYAHLVAAFTQGLNETGFVEGRNVEIDYRGAEGKYDRLPQLAADLVARKVDVIAATGGAASALAAKVATNTIPIVFSFGGDPVKLNLVASFNHPGGNITGVSFLIDLVPAKLAQLMHELVPDVSAIAFLINPMSPRAEPDAADLAAAVETLGQQLLTVRATTENDLELAFETLIQQRVRVVLVRGDPLFFIWRQRLGDLAARNRIVMVANLREYVDSGALMSYGTSLADAYRHQAIIVGRILKGTNPADLPVIQSTKFELIINRKKAKDRSQNF
jgi:putative tryptophan/tyrosine transport system substrate-binding protein